MESMTDEDRELLNKVMKVDPSSQLTADKVRKLMGKGHQEKKLTVI